LSLFSETWKPPDLDQLRLLVEVEIGWGSSEPHPEAVIPQQVLIGAGYRNRKGLGRRGLFVMASPRGVEFGDPGRIRTCNPQSRNLMLYPVELRDRTVCGGAT